MTTPNQGASFDTPLFLQLLRQRGCRLGEPFSYLIETTSTNDVAKDAARRGAPPGATFLADQQTAGRGRRGRPWHARASESLLFSVLLDSTLRADELSALTLAVGLGVRQAISELTKRELRLKWPNDVLFEGRKLAGILVETDVSSRPRRIIAGIGVNVSTACFPEELASIATSLRQMGSELPRETLLAALLTAIEGWVATLEQGDLAHVASEVRRFDALLGRQLQVEGVQGIGRGIDPAGNLLVETDGEIRAVGSGTVEIQR